MATAAFANKLVVGPAPHLGTEDSVPKIMWGVVVALIPALIAGAINFGWYAMAVVAVSVVSAVVTEAVIQRIKGVPVTVSDGSAVITGILLAMVLPPNVPLYVPAVGSAFAIAIAKHAFGGLGCNIWNPALMGRAFLLAAYSGAVVMTKWPVLKGLLVGNILGPDAVTRATPCAVLKSAPLEFFNHYSIWDLFIGRIPGSIGETSALALIAGGIFLIIKKYVNWRLPLSYILTVMIMVTLLPIPDGQGGTLFVWHLGLGTDCGPVIMHALAHAFAGGLMLGAFFMATDMVTSPLTSKGQVYFGIGCGVLVAVIRLYGGYPEGVCYSILIMNTAVWLIDRVTVPRFFGVKGHGEKDA
jgi:electron transport complex protein RnfD